MVYYFLKLLCLLEDDCVIRLKTKFSQIYARKYSLRKLLFKTIKPQDAPSKRSLLKVISSLYRRFSPQIFVVLNQLNHGSWISLALVNENAKNIYFNISIFMIMLFISDRFLMLFKLYKISDKVFLYVSCVFIN